MSSGTIEHSIHLEPFVADEVEDPGSVHTLEGVAEQTTSICRQSESKVRVRTNTHLPPMHCLEEKRVVLVSYSYQQKCISVTASACLQHYIGELICVACLGVVVVAFTLFKPGSDDISDSTVASTNALVLHSKPS